MKIVLLSSVLLPFALVAGLVTTAQHPREQTVFLERVAEKIEKANVIPVPTENAIRSAIRSIRWHGSQYDQQLETRLHLAIANRN